MLYYIYIIKVLGYVIMIYLNTWNLLNNYQNNIVFYKPSSAVECN